MFLLQLIEWPAGSPVRICSRLCLSLCCWRLRRVSSGVCGAACIHAQRMPAGMALSAAHMMARHLLSISTEALLWGK